MEGRIIDPLKYLKFWRHRTRPPLCLWATGVVWLCLATPAFSQLFKKPSKPVENPAQEFVSLDGQGALRVPKSEEAMWIWTKEQDPAAAPIGSVYFRKAFDLKAPLRGQLEITADDAFEIFVNGKPVGSSARSKELHRYDISKFLTRGGNLVAIRVTNTEGKSAGVAARVFVQEAKGWLNLSSDDSWRSSSKATRSWNALGSSDRGWSDPTIIGRLVVNEDKANPGPMPDQKEAKLAESNAPPPLPVPELEPSLREPEVVKKQEPAIASVPPADTKESENGKTVPESDPALAGIKVAEEFRLERMLPDIELGSLISLSFNEFGQMILGVENGPLVLAFDSDRDGQIDKARPWCSEVKNVQGILSLNGDVFVTGDGPKGASLYRLSDADRNGTLEVAATVLKFKGEPGEHGAHGMVLGPDGFIYVSLGNYAQADATIAPTSPYRNTYEGDLTPRYEDPTGHAQGIKAPGGSIIRVPPSGDAVELVAGGLRNAYDLAFNPTGELFTSDSDHEADEGAPWYRTTRLLHVVPGADFGWRSGWAPRPNYFLDNLPPVMETGRGSPTGMVFYSHNAFPVRFQNNLFVGDWSQGRIVALAMERKGAGYRAKPRTFVEGDALNVTDLEVGPDGALYFTTGGRGTAGALYRVSWKGEVPQEFRDLGTGITAAVRQPQLQSAWARQEIARVQQTISANWDRQVHGVAKSTDNPFFYRLRALQLMQLFGPDPDAGVLLRISQDADPEVRSVTAAVLATLPGDASFQRLLALLEDSNPLVRSRACDALHIAAARVPPEKLSPLLASEDSYEKLAARKLLESIPAEHWKKSLLSNEKASVVAQAVLALAAAEPTRENGIASIEAVLKKMAGFVTDEEYLDLMRATQVVILRAELKPDDLVALREILAAEYPTKNALMNNELIRLLVFLKADAVLDRCFARLAQADALEEEKLHLAVHLRYLSESLSGPRKLELLSLYEGWAAKGSGGYARYLPNVTVDLARTCTLEECRGILARGAEWPNAALGALYQLPPQLDSTLLAEVSKIEKQLDGRTEGSARRLQTGLAAVLARSGDADSLALLREIFDRDPERRTIVMVGLAQSPGGANWDYLIRGLSSVEGPAAREVFDRLCTVENVAKDAEPFRHVIIRSLQLAPEGAQKGVALLEHWTGEKFTVEKAETAADMLAPWQAWYAKKFPDAPAAALPEPSSDPVWTVAGLISQLNDSTTPQGDAVRGRLVFEKSQCAKCHRHGVFGEPLGPDLTTVAKRFSTKEIIESMLHPSAVISSQYAAKTLTTADGRTLTGLIAPGVAGETVVIDPTGKRISIRASEIQSTVPANISAMPEGLLNELSVAEIQDLLAFLRGSAGPSLTRRPIGSIK